MQTEHDRVVPLVGDDRVPMTPKEWAELVLSFARVLHVNGESTDETIVAAEGLGASVTPDAAVRAEFATAAARHGCAFLRILVSGVA